MTLAPQVPALQVPTLQVRGLHAGYGSIRVLHGIDFEVEEHETVFDEPWRGRLLRGEITPEQARDAARQFLNVVVEQRFVLVARKAAR